MCEKWGLGFLYGRGGGPPGEGTEFRVARETGVRF